MLKDILGQQIQIEIIFWDVVFQAIHLMQRIRRALSVDWHTNYLVPLTFLSALAGLSLGLVLSLFVK